MLACTYPLGTHSHEQDSREEESTSAARGHVNHLDAVEDGRHKERSVIMLLCCVKPMVRSSIFEEANMNVT
jgi:hypothetical protein